MIRSLQLYGGYQDLQYIHALLMELYFGLVYNLMHQIIGTFSQMINKSNRNPDTPTSNEAMKVPYKADFMQAMTQDIKELKNMVPVP